MNSKVVFVFAVLAICSAYAGVIPLVASPHATVLAEPLAARTIIAGPGEATIVSHSAAHVVPVALSAPVVHAAHIW